MNATEWQKNFTQTENLERTKMLPLKILKTFFWQKIKNKNWRRLRVRESATTLVRLFNYRARERERQKKKFWQLISSLVFFPLSSAASRQKRRISVSGRKKTERAVELETPRDLLEPQSLLFFKFYFLGKKKRFKSLIHLTWPRKGERTNERSGLSHFILQSIGVL